MLLSRRKSKEKAGMSISFSTYRGKAWPFGHVSLEARLAEVGGRLEGEVLETRCGPHRSPDWVSHPLPT